MEASLRFFNPLTSTGRIMQRHCLYPTLRHGRNLLPSFSSNQLGAIDGRINCLSRAHSSLSLRFSNSQALGFLLSAFSSPAFHSHYQHNNEPFNHFKSYPNDDGLRGRWNGDLHQGHGGVSVTGGRDHCVTAVLLGWLGAETKHLKRYAEIYASKGINTLSFVVPVSELLWFDVGRKVESRIERLANEIVAWLENSENESRERCLVFHTFSNTGWLVYGAILNHLQGKPELLERIKGCVMDSGPDPELNPKVWAAGFATAMLKKRSPAVHPANETSEVNPDTSLPKSQQNEPHLTENVLLFVLEKFFSLLFKFPDVNQRLSKVITTLLKSNPACPQLYLYSTADKVVPYEAVEAVIEQQRRMGRKVWSFNFEFSPHVDHFRTFPDLYSTKVSCFLDECLATVKQV